MYNEKKKRTSNRGSRPLNGERQSPSRRKARKGAIPSSEPERIRKPRRLSQQQPGRKRRSQPLKPVKRRHPEAQNSKIMSNKGSPRTPKLRSQNALKKSKKRVFKRWLFFGSALLLLGSAGWLGWQINQGYYQFYRVATNSMMSYGPRRKSDRFAAGDVILVERRALHTLQVNQIVSYRLANRKTVLTHRLVRIERDRGNNIVLLETQGDTNQLPDEPFLPENFLGVVMLRIPFLGQISQVLSESWIRWSAFGSILCLISGSLGWEVYGRWRTYARAQAQLRRKKARKKRPLEQK